jgi:hypothetical protein
MFNPIVTQFINPHNVKIDQKLGFVLEQKRVLDNVPSSFLKLMAILFCVHMFCLLFIRNPNPIGSNENREPEEEEQSQSPNPNQSQPNSDQMLIIERLSKHTSFNEQMTYKTSVSRRSLTGESQMLMSPSASASATTDTDISIRAQIALVMKGCLFWNLCLTILCVPMTYVNSQWKELYISYLGISDDRVLVSMFSVSSICQASSNILLGFVYDWINRRYSHIGAYTIVMSVLTCLMNNGTEDEYVLLIILSFIWLAVLQFASSAVAFLVQLTVAEKYGNKLGAIVYGLVAISFVCATFISMTVITQFRSQFGWQFLNYFWVATQCVLFTLAITSNYWKK